MMFDCAADFIKKNQLQGLVVERVCCLDFLKEVRLTNSFLSAEVFLVLYFVIIVFIGMIIDKIVHTYSIIWVCCLVFAKFVNVIIETFVLIVVKKNWSFLFVFYFNIIITNVFFVFTFLVGAFTINMT